MILLGEAYAFGVIWSFAMKSLAVLMLRFSEPGGREYRVPLNLRIGRLELPIGLCMITVTLFATAAVNLFTKEIATVSGVAFTLVFFGIFTASEHVNRRRGTSHQDLDRFHLVAGGELSPETLGVRAGNIAVMVRDYNTLYPLHHVLGEVNPAKRDVVALHVRVLGRAGSGEHGLVADQLFSFKEQELFTRALNLAEKNGKTIHLAVVPATDVWDGIMRAAQNLKSATVSIGLSPRMPITEEARLAGLAWERLPPPKPQLTLEIWSPTGARNVFYLGPHAPHLTPKEIDALHSLWLDFSCDLHGQDLHHHDVVHFALAELLRSLKEGKRKEILSRLRQHLDEIGPRRRSNP